MFHLKDINREADGQTYSLVYRACAFLKHHRSASQTIIYINVMLPGLVNALPVCS